MKTVRSLIVGQLVLVGGLFLLMSEARAELEVSASVQINAPSDFYNPLGADGSWVEVGGYGRCFRPRGVDADWRPYCEGNWVWTDCGWYWQSDEPWAWACYHYGSWVDDSTAGWIWVPGIEWAPAWVVWRSGGNFVGWAPCAPRQASVAPALFVFVDANRFQDPVRPTSVMVNNQAAISQTKVLPQPGREKRTINGKSQEVVVNRGPDVGQIEKAVGKNMQAVPVQDAIQRTAAPAQESGGRKIEPAPSQSPSVPEREKLPANDTRDRTLPQPDRPAETERPPVTTPTETPRPAETERPPVTAPAESPRPADANGPVLPEQDRGIRPDNPSPSEKPPVQRPAVVPKQQRPEAPPQDQKPENPQPNQDKKDGLERIPSMLV